MSELGTFSCLLSEVRMSEPNTEKGVPISQPVIAQVSRYFTFLTFHLLTVHTHLQQQVFNPCYRIQVVTFLPHF